jgi:hypothetical protein
MQPSVQRKSVDLSAYPDLTVIYLGFKVRSLRGLFSVIRLGKGLSGVQRNPPDGLLRHENLLFGFGHLGIRQYWRDLESLEAFTRAEPHRTWWRDFLKDSGGAGFWHETYRIKGGMEAIYIDMPTKPGLLAFAPEQQPIGPFMSARERLKAA